MERTWNSPSAVYEPPGEETTNEVDLPKAVPVNLEKQAVSDVEMMHVQTPNHAEMPNSLYPKRNYPLAPAQKVIRTAQSKFPATDFLKSTPIQQFEPQGEELASTQSSMVNGVVRYASPQRSAASTEEVSLGQRELGNARAPPHMPPQVDLLQTAFALPPSIQMTTNRSPQTPQRPQTSAEMLLAAREQSPAVGKPEINRFLRSFSKIVT